MFMLKIAGIALLCGGLVFACVRRDNSIREEGRQEVIAQAQALAEANRIAADKASAELNAKHAQSEASLRRKLAAIRAEKSDACAKAKAKVSILDGLK